LYLTRVTTVQIPDAAVDPVIDSGITGEVCDLDLAAGATLSVQGGTTSVFTDRFPAAGPLMLLPETVEYRGSTPQSIVSNRFAGSSVIT
jgi:hypothetical protein